MVQKQANWVTCGLRPRDVELRFFACEQLLQTQIRKAFLHRIMTGDKKWVHYDNPKRGNSQTCLHVDGQIEYSRCQGYALQLVGLGRYGVL